MSSDASTPLRSAMPRKKRFFDPVGSDDYVRGRVFCVECGASLRGKLVTDRCECGHTVTDSVYGDFLMYQEQRDLRRLNSALGLLQYTGITILALIALGVISAVSSAANAEDALASIFEMAFTLAILTPLPATLGITLVTRKRSLAYYRARYGDARFLAIVTGAAAILLVMVVLIRDPYRKALANTLLIAFTGTPSLIFLMGFSRLMRHMPHRALANIAFGLFVVTCVLTAVCWGVLLMRPFAADDDNLGGLVLTLQGISIMIGLGVGATTVHMLIKARRSVAAFAR